MVRNETNSIIKWNPKSNLNFFIFIYLFFTKISIIRYNLKKNIRTHLHLKTYQITSLKMILGYPKFEKL